MLGDTSEYRLIRQNLSTSQFRAYPISRILHTSPHTVDDSTIHIQSHLQLNLCFSTKSEPSTHTPRYSEILCTHHCCIVYSPIWPPLWLYLLIWSICNFVYNSGLIVRGHLSQPIPPIRTTRPSAAIPAYVPPHKHNPT